MLTARSALPIATVLYALALAASFSPRQRPGFKPWLLLPAIGANAAAVALRYWQAWPMLPMHLGSAALPLFMGLMAALPPAWKTGDAQESGVRRAVLALAFLLAASAVCFPKDFYLPFLKSATPFAHLFFLFGTAGKGCFLFGAARAAFAWQRVPRCGRQETSLHAESRWFPPIAWGFVLWTLSMFAGELWSYRGWGTPVVWDDPAIVAAMATWFFYIGLLHLHLTRTWGPRGRAVFAALGGAGVLTLNCVPDFGPFRPPF
jgi:ABC-type transport system involved in cytochrome c biogenesis permease subunit